MKPDKFKKYLKEKISNAALKYLENIRLSHSKGSNLRYNKLKCQQYLKSFKLHTTEKFLLFKLRTQMTDVRSTF